jgi:hypothetical protein
MLVKKKEEQISVAQTNKQQAGGKEKKHRQRQTETDRETERQRDRERTLLVDRFV